MPTGMHTPPKAGHAATRHGTEALSREAPSGDRTPAEPTLACTQKAAVSLGEATLAKRRAAPMQPQRYGFRGRNCSCHLVCISSAPKYAGWEFLNGTKIPTSRPPKL